MTPRDDVAIMSDATGVVTENGAFDLREIAAAAAELSTLAGWGR